MRRLIFWIWKNARIKNFGCNKFCVTCPYFDKCSYAEEMTMRD